MTDVKAEARTDRLKAALRENLKRRKAQARGREKGAEPREEPPAGSPLRPKDRAGGSD